MVADIISFLAQASTITLIVAYIFGLWAALVLWTWFDIGRRTDNIIFRFGAVLLVAFGFLLGFVIYLILRPGQTREEIEFRNLEEKIFEAQSKASICYNCGSVLEPEFSYCATCGVKVRHICENCEKQISHTWRVCPYCSHPQSDIERKEISVGETVEPNGYKLAVFSFVRSIKLPKITLRGGVTKKRGRPKKEKTEPAAKRPRGRPRKQIKQPSEEA